MIHSFQDDDDDDDDDDERAWHRSSLIMFVVCSASTVLHMPKFNARYLHNRNIR